MARGRGIHLDGEASAGASATCGARVLHYACCGLRRFACKDWAALGYLDPSGRFGDGHALPYYARWTAQQDGQTSPAREARADELFVMASGPTLATRIRSLELIQAG